MADRALLVGLAWSAQCSGGFTSEGLRPGPLLSNGVSSKLTQVPCRSGWPSGVRPSVHFFVAGACANIAVVATTIATLDTKRTTVLSRSDDGGLVLVFMIAFPIPRLERAGPGREL